MPISLIIKYWPVIRFFLGLLKSNSGLLKDLYDRPDTGPGEDARDFFREIDRKNKWNPFNNDIG